ncbi:conserved unknown protein [Ectocarpus siliculosus]|uniref:Thioredoxin domain-containing protein n=1 Tax=Ectocarpus siliculosus TaxID=2880 RepID=D7FVX6_ECTSI|nr:conserved unknown protein [Ectocarpus siliculosus]|eukprot:CBJ25496.1 conserved unknown protein [Ectocarpus siliculosus]
MANPKAAKKKRPPPPPPSRLAPWYPAVVAMGVAVALAFLAKALAPPIHFLSTYNRNQMKDVFLGKGMWVVLCSGEGAGYDAVYKRFGTASKAMTGSAKFGVVDCAGSLPSGKSILQKFDLSEEVKPVLFVTGAGLTPAQASSRNMETHASLLKWVQVMATPGASPVTSTRELESKCLKKERCALVMKAGPLEDDVKDAFKDLMGNHRNLKFVSIDSTKLETSLEKKLGIKPVDGSHQLVHFIRYNVTGKVKVGTPRWGVQLYSGALETASMSVFIEGAAIVGTKEETALTRLPTVMTRKEPKAKPPPPPPKAEGGEGGGASAEGLGGAGKYEGMDKEKLLEAFRKKQAEREVARRKEMDEEADNFLFEAVDEGDQEGIAGETFGLEEDGDGDKEQEEEEEEEEIVDLDEM